MRSALPQTTVTGTAPPITVTAAAESGRCESLVEVLCEPRRFFVGETSPGLGQPVGPHQPADARLDPGGLSGAGRGLGAAQGEPVVVANAVHIHRARGESQELVGLVE